MNACGLRQSQRDHKRTEKDSGHRDVLSIPILGAQLAVATQMPHRQHNCSPTKVVTPFTLSRAVVAAPLPLTCRVVASPPAHLCAFLAIARLIAPHSPLQPLRFEEHSNTL